MENENVSATNLRDDVAPDVKITEYSEDDVLKCRRILGGWKIKINFVQQKLALSYLVRTSFMACSLSGLVWGLQYTFFSKFS